MAFNYNMKGTLLTMYISGADYDGARAFVRPPAFLLFGWQYLASRAANMSC